MINKYLVIIGDLSNKHSYSMEERLYKLGVVTKVLDNIFTLIIDTENSIYTDMEKVRNYVAGEERGYCLVINVNKKVSCAWSLSGENNIKLSNFLKDGEDETK